MLAASVVHRAFQDLGLIPGRYATYYREDAYDFLINRLWDEECVWREVLEKTLIRQRVVKEAKRLYEEAL